jgi:hypothetical protein
MTISEIDAAAVETTSRNDAMYLEPRCRICRSDEVRARVNDLLASGSSYASILRAFLDGDSVLDPRDQVTINSVRNHATRHFPVQNAARATYREILERRAKENGVDFANGLATAITPMALLETVMVKGYENLVDPNTDVDVKTTILAASRLQELLDSRAGQADAAQMMAQMNRVIELVKTYVPREQWPALQAALRGEPVARNGELAEAREPRIRMVHIDDSPDEADEL